VNNLKIRIANETGSTEELSNVSIPWEKSFTVKKSDNFYASISAQNVGGSPGTITVKIYKDGDVFDVFKESKSVLEYGIASASGSI
jgi:hypothetical protein